MRIVAALALLALSAAPVAAQEVTFTETEGGGIVHYQNHLTLWKPANVVETFTFSTDLGTVVMQLTRTPNDQCADPWILGFEVGEHSIALGGLANAPIPQVHLAGARALLGFVDPCGRDAKTRLAQSPPLRSMAHTRRGVDPGRFSRRRGSQKAGQLGCQRESLFGWNDSAQSNRGVVHDLDRKGHPIRVKEISHCPCLPGCLDVFLGLLETGQDPMAPIQQRRPVFDTDSRLAGHHLVGHPKRERIAMNRALRQ